MVRTFLRDVVELWLYWSERIWYAWGSPAAVILAILLVYLEIRN